MKMRAFRIFVVFCTVFCIVFYSVAILFYLLRMLVIGVSYDSVLYLLLHVTCLLIMLYVRTPAQDGGTKENIKAQEDIITAYVTLKLKEQNVTLELKEQREKGGEDE
jgi:hypothetical protein